MTHLPEQDRPIDWSLTTWEGGRREQLRRWSVLPLDRVIAALEEMADLAQVLGHPHTAVGSAPSETAGPSVVHEGSPAYFEPGSSIHLRGCTPEPLIGYLKGLGTLRIVSEQEDAQARALWAADHLTLISRLTPESLLDFFIYRYQPTPIVVPWSGSDFFGVEPSPGRRKFRKTPTSSRVIEAFLACESPRLAHYRATIASALAVIRNCGIEDKSALSNKRIKAQLLTALRAVLPPAAVAWLDAAAAMEEGGPKFNALLGSGGGSDGNTHFSDNFMQNLWDVLPDFAEQRQRADAARMAEDSRALLGQALFGHPAHALVEGRTSSLFDSGAVGGPNATHGFERASFANPWNVVLALEGSVAFAGALSRRLAVARGGAASTFPFVVRTVASAPAGLTGKESGSREAWLPLWRKPARMSEMGFLLSEGRAEWGGRTARTAVDMARAACSLGVDRGVAAFQRFAMVRGRVGGENYHTAVGLGRFEVSERESVDLLREADRWLDAFRQAARDQNAPPRFGRALRAIDEAILDFCRYGGTGFFQRILVALGRAERELGSTTNSEKRPRPIEGLSAAWRAAADDGSPEFELAQALASIYDPEFKVGSFRINLEPVHRRHADGRATGWLERNRSAVWTSSDLETNLAAVLSRRLMEGSNSGCRRLPLAASSFTSLHTVARFLAGHTDDRRIADLLWGLALVRQSARPRFGTRATSMPAGDLTLPRAYALLKLLFLPEPMNVGGATIEIRPEPAILSLLAANRIGEACRVANRRLRASGLFPMPHARETARSREQVWSEACGHVRGSRLAAALLVPVAPPAVGALHKLVLREPAAPRPTVPET